jgi:hypothetical protein
MFVAYSLSVNPASGEPGASFTATYTADSGTLRSFVTAFFLLSFSSNLTSFFPPTQ